MLPLLQVLSAGTCDPETRATGFPVILVLVISFVGTCDPGTCATRTAATGSIYIYMYILEYAIPRLVLHDFL